MPPAFVYLDLGNVIAPFERQLAFDRMAAVCGADAAAVRQAVLPDLQAELESGRLDWGGFHAEFSRRTGTRSDASLLAEAASDMFVLNAALLPVIAALERARMPLGILSNTCEIHWRHLLGLRWGILPGRFREFVLSYEAGSSKPERAIYELAARRAGVAPEAIFFCDDLPQHVTAAREAGWDAEVFTSAAGLAAELGRRGINLGL